MKNTSKEDRFKKIVESIDGIAWEADAKTFEFLYVSPQSKSILGYDPEEWYNTNFWQSKIHPEDRTYAIRFCHEKTKAGENHTFEYRFIKSNGDIIWVRDVVTVQNKNGVADRLTGLLIDITSEKKEIEKSQRLLKDAYTLAGIGHWELDLVKLKLFWSDSVRELHEVDDDYDPVLDEAIAFYTEGDRKIIKNVVDRAIKFGESFDEELQIITRKGNTRWVHVVGKPEFKNGECIALYGSTQNIDRKKQVERDLRETDQKLRDIIEHSTNMFYRHDVNHILQYASPQFEKFLGYDHGEILDDWTILTTDHPINQKGFELTQKAIDTGKAQPQYELQLKKKSGEPMWVRVYEAPVVEDGKTVAIVGSLTNITESKKYEEQLKKLSLVASKTTDFILISDQDDKVLWVNESFEKFTGYSLEECRGEHPSTFLRGPDTDIKTAKALDEAAKRRESHETVILNYRKNGESYWTDITMDPIVNDFGEFTGFISIGKDVSALVARENSLRESVERYEIVSKATSDTIWDLDLNNDLIRYNDNIHQMFGYKKNEVEDSGEWWRRKIHPEDYSQVMSKIDQALEDKSERFQLEYRFKCADGSFKYIYDRAFIVSNDKGKPARMIGAMQDVTDQKNEKRWLELLESVVRNTTEAIAILEAKPLEKANPGRKILYVNDAFTSMTGFTRDEAVGETLFILKGEKTSDETLEHLAKKMNRWEPCQAEFLNYKKDGTEFWVSVSMAPVIDEDGDHSHWVFVGRDVTDRREHEEKLSESLVEKDTLLVEIHHRVKNNLAVVSSMMLLQALEEKNEEVTERLYDSVARIKAMANIHELLYNSKSFSNINFSENISKLANSVLSTLRTDVDISLNLDCKPTELNVNQAIPCSLILNEILTNAVKHAFPDRKSGSINIKLNSTDNNVHLSVTDDGCGVPEAYLEDVKSTVGLHLVDVLSRQLKADYSFTTNNGKGGTGFTLNFKKIAVKGIGNAHL